MSSAATKNNALTSWQRDDLIPAWSSYFRTPPVSLLLGDHPHPLLWHRLRPRRPFPEPQPCLWAARATPQRQLHEFVGRSDILVPALGHLSLTASLQTIREETVPYGHTGTPLAFKHGARTSLSVHFSGLLLSENTCVQTLGEFMGVPLFKEITWLPHALSACQVFVSLNSPVLPFHLGTAYGPPMCSHGLFQTFCVPPHPRSLHRCCKLAAVPHSLSNGVGKAGTVCVHMPVEMHTPGYPLQGDEQQQGVWLPKQKDPEDAKVSPCYHGDVRENCEGA